MKKIDNRARKTIIVALLGLCVVASTYSTARAVPAPSQSNASPAITQPGATPQDIWFAPFWAFYYYSYVYYGYYYYFPYVYYCPYYYGGVVVVV